MQPKTARTKEPLPQAKRETVQREFSPAEQWDQLAYTLILQELAPKGFKEITRGPYRGTVEANIPFLAKKTVHRCQNISAQLVRSFRQKEIRQITDRIAMCEKEQSDAIRLREAAYFWQFKTKRGQQRRYEHYRDQSGLLTIIINELNNLSIK